MEYIKVSRGLVPAKARTARTASKAGSRLWRRGACRPAGAFAGTEASPARRSRSYYS